jgi:peptide/nickel transport system ATP-binding protein
MTVPPALLDIRRLSRDYASANLFGRPLLRRALDEVSFTVAAGEIFGLVGESGSGKSTLARLVMALDRPSTGEVVFDGAPLFQLAPAALKAKRAAFQMVFQDPFGSLDPRQTVGRIVAEPLHLSPCLTAERRDRVARMLENVGLGAEVAGRYPHEFSGGQRQRIAIARALITEPKLVVADEAVSALDLSVQGQVLNLILDLRDRRGVGFLFISHNLGVVDCIADRVGVMYRGRLVELGPAHALFDAPLHPYTRLLVEAEPALHRPGPPPAPEPGDGETAGCAFAPRCAAAGPRCRVERPEFSHRDGDRAVACHHPLG